VRDAVPDVRWVVVGDGGLRPELERAAREAGLGDAVRFAGGLDDAARDAWLDRAWAFVMPSRAPGGDRAGEGFGIVFLEAGAHGLPVVAGRVPGVVDAVGDGTTGLLVDPTDPAAVAAAVTEVLTDPEAAARMGAAGAARAQEQAWPRVVARVQDMLEAQVAAGPSRPARPPRDWRWARDLVAAPPAP
jgi:phosphatidylinositol alpha-1,6-mannosyltransferase